MPGSIKRWDARATDWKAGSAESTSSETGPRQLAAVQRGQQRVVIHQPAPGDVHEEAVVAHSAPDGAGSTSPGDLAVSATCSETRLGGREYVVQFGALDAGRPRVVGDVGVVRCHTAEERPARNSAHPGGRSAPSRPTPRAGVEGRWRSPVAK